MKALVYLASARRSLTTLPAGVQSMVSDKLTRYASTGAGDVKAMRGVPGLRLRCGDYRVLFEEDATTIVVRAIDHRSKIYR